jgi:KUP system potassium uptake protein
MSFSRCRFFSADYRLQRKDARMAKNQTVVLPPSDPQKPPAAVALAALGVVYGDIGTSTLYGLKQAIEAGGAPTPEIVLGIVSVILSSRLLIVALKYAVLIFRPTIMARAA